MGRPRVSRRSVCVALTTRADSAENANQEQTFKPVASVQSLMHGQVKFFKELAKHLQEAPGEHRNEELVEGGEVLAELANVNRLNSEKQDYRAWATQLRDTALALAKEAKKPTPDEAGLKKLYQTLKDTCASCHDAHQ